MVKRNKGFTLVELLAVIVILAIILVIAVPKVMSVIEDSKKATLESTAKMIASQAEKVKVQNKVLGKTDDITCESVAKINDLDYDTCSIDFVDNIAKVTIKGKGKFNGLWVCDGTKTDAEAQKDLCVDPIEVKHPLFLVGQELTPDKFDVTLNESDGSTRKLHSGGPLADDSKAVTVTSPNWPEYYEGEDEKIYEYEFENAEQIQITFDSDSSLDLDSYEDCDDEGNCHDISTYDYIWLYDKDGTEIHQFNSDNFAGKTYNILGNYVKIKFKYTSPTGGADGFSATIEPVNDVPTEYTVSPSVVPNIEGEFDITITINGQNISKKITTKTVHEAKKYLEALKSTDIEQTNVEYNGTTYDAGLRYVGKIDNVKNKVYFNCNDTDNYGVSYGEANYNYSSSCEVWRIIGVFDVDDGNGNIEKRLKLVNIESTFEASWDSSASNVNLGNGSNQWGPNGDYNGADLMQLLNGYYIGKSTTSGYNIGGGQDNFVYACDTEGNRLEDMDMKPLTNNALDMIKVSKWDTYAINNYYLDEEDEYKPIYLQEKGIANNRLGDYACQFASSYSESKECNDGITRSSSWNGLVGLMYYSDMLYSKGWIYNNEDQTWLITPYTTPDILRSTDVMVVESDGMGFSRTCISNMVWPSVYLKSDIKIIGGNGYDEPYKLAM